MQESVPHTPAISMSMSALPSQQSYDRRQQLFRELLGHSELLLKNQLEVRHLMTHDLVTIPPQTTLDEMARLMKQHRLHHLLVCGRGGELVGIISDRDLYSRRGGNAQQLMTFPVRTVTPETPVSPAITYLVSESISCLPVVEKGKPCGVLTTSDLVLTLQSMLQLWLRLTQVLQQDLGWAKELDRIVASLEGDLTAAQLVERVAEARQLLRQQVHDIVNTVDLRTDVLTGIGNRWGLEDVLGMLLAVHRRYQQPFALVVAVIDHFHRIQQICGDAVVRTLAKSVARVIGDSIRDTDFAARIRDEAFAVAMPQTSLDEAEAFCARLRETARQSTDLDVELRISAGAVVPEPGEDVEGILRRAETVMA